MKGTIRSRGIKDPSNAESTPIGYLLKWLLLFPEVRNRGSILFSIRCNVGFSCELVLEK